MVRGKSTARLVMVVCLVLLQACASTRVETRTAEDRYKLVSDSMPRLATGGRISRVNWSEDGSSMTYTRDNKRYRYDLAARTLEAASDQGDAEQPASRSQSRPRNRPQPGRGRQRDRERSPDEKWTAACKDWNVVLEPADGGGDPVQVTTDGNRKFRYGTASWVYGEELDQHDAMWWSPDSSKLVFYEFDERKVPDHFITAGLTDLHTRVLTEGYPKPGEPNPIANLLIYDVATKQTIRVDPAEDEDWYTYSVQFAPCGSPPVLVFHRTNRHQNVLQLVAADIETGKTRIILTETQETWQDNEPEMKFLEDGHRFIWATEKTGWKQYELRDLDGTLIKTLTTGSYPAASIQKIDEAAGVLYYTAFSDANPLNAELQRVGLDGKGQMRLTREPQNHSIRLSPDGKWFITEYESVDTPPATALYDTQGHRIATLAQSDTAQARKLDLQKPELFHFKADDGKTDIYGVLYKPSHFKESQKYPLVIDVYGGPLSQSVRNRFVGANPACEYGCLIAEIDNRGTRNRGKEFESATYLKLGDVDIKDQADGVRYLKRRKYVDGYRVGIYGHSYGGYMSALALLKFPDLFQAAAAGGTVTDWRNYDTIYTERFMRTPQENPQGYDAGSCLTYAKQLKGKLLLLHGMVDDNVHSNNVWQLVDALEKEDKPFEMMFYPNGGHSLGTNSNSVRWQFLRRCLMQ